MLTVLASVVLRMIMLSMNARLASDSVVNVLRPFQVFSRFSVSSSSLLLALRWVC
jgi:hypothetical protein